MHDSWHLWASLQELLLIRQHAFVWIQVNTRVSLFSKENKWSTIHAKKYNKSNNLSAFVSEIILSPIVKNFYWISVISVLAPHPLVSDSWTKWTFYRLSLRAFTLTLFCAGSFSWTQIQTGWCVQTREKLVGNLEVGSWLYQKKLVPARNCDSDE